jgi:hypothetical protein
MGKKLNNKAVIEPTPTQESPKTDAFEAYWQENYAKLPKSNVADVFMALLKEIVMLRFALKEEKNG